VILSQLTPVLARSGIESLSRAVIAYEPVWAIGTGHTATPEQAQEVHGMIRRHLGSLNPGVAAQVPLLYGGSVNPGNAAQLFAAADIDGGLVGGASLKADDFVSICQSLG
jgi:triosephosphate isomerase